MRHDRPFLQLMPRDSHFTLPFSPQSSCPQPPPLRSVSCHGRPLPPHPSTSPSSPHPRPSAPAPAVPSPPLCGERLRGGDLLWARRDRLGRVLCPPRRDVGRGETVAGTAFGQVSPQRRRIPSLKKNVRHLQRGLAAQKLQTHLRNVSPRSHAWLEYTLCVTQRTIRQKLHPTYTSSSPSPTPRRSVSRPNGHRVPTVSVTPRSAALVYA